MDFASLMSKELSKSSGGNSAKKDNSNKFLKRSEIEAQRESNYISEQKALAKERDTKAAAKRKLEEDTIADNKLREERRRKLAEESKRRREDQEWEEEQARRKRLGLPERERPNPDAEDDKDKIPPNEDIEEEDLRLKLRELGHAAILFGESHAARLRRYKKLTTVLTTGPIPTTLKLVEEKDMKVETVPQDKDGREFLFRQLASYFTMVLIAYEKAMDGSRTSTTEGKAAYAAMVQARENMRPLFRKLESGDLDDSLLVPLVEIVKALQERRYVDANNGYLRLSIGKAAWPIGVTMVGIHERSAREKLHDGEKGHVMGDEVRWPPDDLTQLMG